MEYIDYFGTEMFFEEDYSDAKSYHRRALQFNEEGRPASLIFNVAAVALERYLVALCDLYGVEPMNHNYISLMITVDKFLDVPATLSKEIKSLDQIFGICFLDDYHHGTPDASDAVRTLLMCDDVVKLFDEDKITLLRIALENNKCAEVVS